MLTTSFPRHEDDSAGSFIHCLAKELVRCDVHVTVVAPGDASAMPHEVRDGVTIHRFSYWWPRSRQSVAYGGGIPNNVRRNPWLVLQLPAFLASFMFTCFRVGKDWDIIHAHWTPTGLIGWLMGRLLRKPVVLTVHGTDIRSLAPSFSKFVINNVDFVIAPSTEMFSLVSRISPTKVRLIGLPVDSDRFHPNVSPISLQREFGVPEDCFVVTFVGRLDPFKDPTTLVKAIPVVLQTRRDVRFLIIGDGVLRQELVSTVSSLGIQDSVCLPGTRGDVHRILKSSDLFVALSPVENVWSMTLIEAMVMEVPCIISRAGLSGSFFHHLKDSFLIEPGDEISLATAIAELLDNKELRVRLTQGATKLLREHQRDNDTIMRQLLDAYKGILLRQPPAESPEDP